MTIFQEMQKKSKPKLKATVKKKTATKTTKVTKPKVKPKVVEKDKDFEEFDKWQRDFIAKYGYGNGNANLYAFNTCRQRHEKMMEILGGHTLTTRVEIEPSVSKAPMRECREHINVIKKILPNYHSYYGVTDEIFTHGGNINGVKLGKHITRYSKMVGVSPSEEKELNKVVSKLGEKWAQYKNKKIDMYCTLSVHPRAFMTLGHYGPDQGSCFGQRGAHVNHKYTLSQATDTFVLLIHNEEPEDALKPENESTMVRAWGFFNRNQNVYNVCNQYSRMTFLEGDRLAILKEQFAKLLNIEVSKLHKRDENIYSTSGIYLNPGNKWSFYEDGKRIDAQYVPAYLSL